MLSSLDRQICRSCSWSPNFLDTVISLLRVLRTFPLLMYSIEMEFCPRKRRKLLLLNILSTFVPMDLMFSLLMNVMTLKPLVSMLIGFSSLTIGIICQGRRYFRPNSSSVFPLNLKFDQWFLSNRNTVPLLKIVTSCECMKTDLKPIPL